MEELPRILPLQRKSMHTAKPLLSFNIILRNGNTIDLSAHDWSEMADDEGAGVAYTFWVDKTPVLHLEYHEVRAVLCKEHVDAAAIKKALTTRPRRPAKEIKR